MVICEADWRWVISAKSGKNRNFSHISLCAKFNRFFIILGGVQNDRKTTILVVLGSYILGFLGKNRENPWYSIIIFRWFFNYFEVRIYGGSDPIYGKIANFRQKSGKKHGFWRILLCAKFNRFFIILGGGGRWPKTGKTCRFGRFSKSIIYYKIDKYRYRAGNGLVPVRLFKL